MDYEPMYGNFELIGKVVGKDNPKIGYGYKEDIDKSGNKRRTLKFMIKTLDDNFVPVQYYGTELKDYSFDKIKEINDTIKDGDNVKISGSLRYDNNGLNFSIFKCNQLPKKTLSEEINSFKQPIVFNKIIQDTSNKTRLSTFMYTNKKGNYNTYDFYIDMSNKKLVDFINKMSFGDLITAKGKIMANPLDIVENSYNIVLMINDFIYEKYRRKIYTLEDFKDEEMKSIFNGYHPNLQNLI